MVLPCEISIVGLPAGARSEAATRYRFAMMDDDKSYAVMSSYFSTPENCYDLIV